MTKKISIYSLLSVLTLTIATPSFADGMEIVGTLPQAIEQSNLSTPNSHSEKIIQLLRVKLSPEEKARIAQKAQLFLQNQTKSTFSSANTTGMTPKVQLGMNKVPVLDQGSHGTCVTFAVTGALDAALGKGDYISQLCSLQLGNYLEQHGNGLSGWDGTNAYNLVEQLEYYGIVNMSKQKSLGCGGLKKYPTYSPEAPTSYITPEKYRAISEMIFGKTIYWNDVYNWDNSEKMLNDVKQALSEKDRVVFGVLLPRTDLGNVGAVGKHKTWIGRDSWVLTPEIVKAAPKAEAGHEMIITGYDDDAVATDNYGKKHKGLLTLRNSWGNSTGHKGDFYMSYDYFKLLTSEAKRFTKIS